MELNKKIDELQDELIKSTQELIKIKSVEGQPKEGMPYGEGPAKALEVALNMAKELGFKTVNVDGYVGYAEYGTGEDYVGVLGHLDVVPEGDGWNYPAYGAEIHDGKMYGRGTTDDKGPIIAALYGLKAIKELNIPLSKRVRVIFGTNEETGSNELEYYLKKEKPPVLGFTPDGMYPIINGEKGITIFNMVKELNKKGSGEVVLKYIKGGTRANVVPGYCEVGIKATYKDMIVDAAEHFKERTAYDIKAEVKDDLVIVKSFGVPAHGSTPEKGKNAIMQLLAFIGELDLGKCDVADYVNFFNRYVGMETNGESIGAGLKDEISGELSFNLGVINVTEDKADTELNLRYPVTCKYDDMMNPINERLQNTGIKIENMTHREPLYFEPKHELIKKLKKVYKEQTGNEATLLSIGGGTYAKEMPNIVAFGPIFPGKPDLDHQANEYIEIGDLVLNAKIYAHAIQELAK